MKKRWHFLLALILLAGLGAWLWLLWLEQSYREEPYALVEDRLYLGASVTEPPPGTKAVLNLCGREDPYAVDNLLWQPILEGGKDPDLAWLGRMVEFIDTQQRAGHTTFVHCMAGMNRSGMVVTAYLMFKHNWSRDQALAFVQRKRPQVQPNPQLMRLLNEWGTFCRRSRNEACRTKPGPPDPVCLCLCVCVSWAEMKRIFRSLRLKPGCLCVVG